MKLLLRISFIAGFLLLGQVLSFAQTPERIVSLAPSITESLYQLGVEKNLIAVTCYCNYPPQAKAKEIIGTLTNPNIEKIYSLSPDLVLAIEGTNRPQAIDKMKDLGLRVEVLKQSKNFSDLLDNFCVLAELVGKSKQGEEIVAGVEAKVAEISSKVKDSPSLSVFWEVGVKPLITIGTESFANEFINYSGAHNIFADVGVIYPRISRDEVIKKNPDVIILVVGMGDVTVKERKYWDKFSRLKAVKLDRIYVIEADKVCRPTPLSFLIGLEEISRFIHPEVFNEE